MQNFLFFKNKKINLLFVLLFQNILWPMMGQSRTSKILLLMTFLWINTIALDTNINSVQGGILYPRESETREVKSLDGIWNFRLSGPDPLIGFKEKWYTKDLSKVGSTVHVSLRNICIYAQVLHKLIKYVYRQDR